MNLPGNTQLPFFAYGLFKPGQLCYFRIKDFVESTSPAEINGYLKERDGIPLLIIAENHLKIKGVLIRFKSNYENEAYKRIVEIEPDKVYKWDECTIAENLKVNLLIGNRPERGSKDFDGESWNGTNDLLFSTALEEIEDILKNNTNCDWSCKPLLRLQMAYVLLWSGLERYASLRYYLGKPNKTGQSIYKDKILKIAEEEVFAKSLKNHIKQTRKVYSSDELETCTLDPDNPKKSIEYYYQVRSNSVHRGKTIFDDFKTLQFSLHELLAIFKDLLNDAWNS
ncbi:MAG: hypothetical protein ACD_79C00511G0003 [uncultured bacterium]|nr:MAG: hypothetical protein ACD_79C00511G0003 [uncultured bacterium]